jgi:hypothetical protein
LWWVPGGGGKNVALGDRNGSGGGIADDEKHLAVLTGEAEVYIWDVGQRRCVKRLKVDIGVLDGCWLVPVELGLGGWQLGWFSFHFFLRFPTQF